jgi:hypothetical protein
MWWKKQKTQTTNVMFIYIILNVFKIYNDSTVENTKQSGFTVIISEYEQEVLL